MAEPDVQSKIEEAVTRGDYPDRKAAIAGLMKQLIDYQKGMLKGQSSGNPVDEIEKLRDEKWKALMEKAGGDDEKAIRLYIEEIKKISQ